MPKLINHNTDQDLQDHYPSDADRAIFYFFSSFSKVNHFLPLQLKEGMSRISWEVKDVEELYPRRHWRNVLATAFEYRGDLLRRERSPRGLFHHSTNYFRAVQASTKEFSTAVGPKFTFQTQSLWSAATPRIPHFVYTDHTEKAFDRYPFFKDRKRYPDHWITLEKKVYDQASHIFTTSEFCIESLVEDYGVAPEKCSCVHSGINMQHRLNSPDNKLYDSKNILFIGVQWERKGGPELMEAFRKLRSKHPEATLTIIGCNPELPDIEGVEILGFVNTADLRPHFEKATVFCLPSLAEPSSVALVEAYAYYLPVVTTNTGGSAERVLDERTGLVIPPKDVKALFKALDTIISNPALAAKMGKRGRELMDKNFTWPRVVEKIKNTLKDKFDLDT